MVIAGAHACSQMFSFAGRMGSWPEDGFAEHRFKVIKVFCSERRGGGIAGCIATPSIAQNAIEWGTLELSGPPALINEFIRAVAACEVAHALPLSATLSPPGDQNQPQKVTVQGSLFPEIRPRLNN